MTKNCKHCGKEFGPGKYPGNFKRQVMCSRECMHAAKRFQPARFWAKTDQRAGPDACWPYRGCRDKWGYAHCGRAGKRHQAHRLAYELANGPIPAGKLVMHTCDNPPCCNPKHLRLGTDADNQRDMRVKGRAALGSRLRAKLNEDQVREIRRAHRIVGRRTNTAELAAKYGVSAGTIAALIYRGMWSHVK